MATTVQKTGSMAIGAIIAAALSFILTLAGHPIYGLLAAVVSVPLGIVGFMMAASPRVSGGMLSIVAIVIGLVAIGFAVLGLIGVAIF